MILLMILATLAIADEPVDRTESIYASYCVSCHGESIDKIPLKPETTTEDRVAIIGAGVRAMPPYNWILQDGEAEKLVKYMESIK
jgi:mono/diheme cytochrome c family protein|tara:strand:+ start:815 stop:1069 length:255 start_codon:yes stop_codon:yes gene_type:complete